MMDLSDFISETIAEITTGLLAGQQRVAAHGVDIKTAGGDQGDITNQPANNYTYNDIGQLTGNKQDGHYFRYDVTGKVTGVYGDANHTSPIAAYAYDDRGFRIKKTDPKTTTHYVRDAAGSILAVYQNGALTELPVYGAGRLGIAYKTENTLTHTYELSDHLGSVRAVVQRKNNTADITNATDYYPGGMSMANRILIGGQKYRFGYQGQFAEKDDETGYHAFQLRQYDSRIMRWITPEPYGQYFSPYMSMGNSWANRWDPDGGGDCPPGVVCLDEIIVMGTPSETPDGIKTSIIDWSLIPDLSAIFHNKIPHHLYKDLLKNGFFIDNETNAHRIMAKNSLYKKDGDEYNVLTLEDQKGNKFAFVNPHYSGGVKRNTSAESIALPPGKFTLEEGAVYITVNNNRYKVLYSIHTHPAGTEFPSSYDLDVGKLMNMFFVTHYNVRYGIMTEQQRNKLKLGDYNPNPVIGTQIDLMDGKW